MAHDEMKTTFSEYSTVEQIQDNQPTY